MRRLLSGIAAVGLLAIATGGIASAGEPDEVGIAASSSVVVNEVSTRGPNGVLDDFIEIRNITNAPVDLSNYQIKVYSQANTLLETITVPEGVVLQPRGNLGQFLVVTSQNFSGTVQDETYLLPAVFTGEGIPSRGGVAIFGPSGTKIDGVAFSTSASTPREGAAALSETVVTEPLAASSARDILSTDTDNNRMDFSLHLRTPGAMN